MGAEKTFQDTIEFDTDVRLLRDSQGTNEVAKREVNSSVYTLEMKDLTIFIDFHYEYCQLV